MAGETTTAKISSISTSSLADKQPDVVFARLLFVGEDSLQMSILKSLVSEEFSLPAVRISAAAIGETENFRQQDTLLILDCHSLTSGDISEIFQQFTSSSSPGVMLLNLKKDSDHEALAAWQPVTGMLHADLSPELAIDGFRKVLTGGLWLPRNIMESLILSNGRRKSQKTEASVPNVQLTRRETQILMKLAEGASNTQIADALFLSEHTVKTHLYNIYRKVNVKNRTQASNWLKNNL